VVGGGVIGCACAAELAGRGASVTLLERAELAAGASGRNHGLLLSPLDPALVPMARASAEIYEQLAKDSPIPFRLDPETVGFLLVAGDDDAERASGKEEAEAAAACGVPVQAVDVAEIHRLEPDLASDLVEGWLFDDARRLDPAALTVALAFRARRDGGDVRTSTVVRSLIADGDAVRGVVTDQGSLEGDVVVLAAGPWTPSLLRTVGLRSPITGGRGWLVHLAPPRSVVSRVISRAGWHRVPPRDEPTPPITAADLVAGPPKSNTGTLLQPNADGTLLVGGSREAVVTGEPEDPTVPQRLVRGAIRLAPALAEAIVLGAWWGIRPMTPDGRPIVGAVRPGLVVAAGHGALGVILGAGTARLVGSIVLGEDPPFDTDPFSPARFG
jgi:glycine/D-amino acid oxidase-like deaminating enzyme